MMKRFFANRCRSAVISIILPILFILFNSIAAYTQAPPIEPGVSQELAKWRAAHYSDVRYKLNLTLERMSPVLKGSMEIRVNVSAGTQAPSPANAGSSGVTDIPIILDWRKIKGSENLSTISNVLLNGKPADVLSPQAAIADKSVRVPFEELNEHITFRDGVVLGENVIKLDFTSPILTSGSAITRYIDKEDGAEYIYSLFVPSDASTAFPVFDQPDLKARFKLSVTAPYGWAVASNAEAERQDNLNDGKSGADNDFVWSIEKTHSGNSLTTFNETRPISSYVFAFAAGDFTIFNESDSSKALTSFQMPRKQIRTRFARDIDPKASANVIQLYEKEEGTQIYVRKSQAEKFKPHAAEVFRLNREGIKFLETYFDYRFPFPKYDIVLIPEFPFGGMEHAGATFLRESAVIFPQEPTKSDHITRANLIFHEAAHQWFGDTVTMKWFDDLWLKEGFAEFMAYKTLEKVMPEANAWKVFYERNKQAAYLTDSTKGTTPIYQPIANLNSAKSAYGNIVYRKAPSFLKQAEFYLGPDKFQTAVRAFLKKHEFANAGWEDLVKKFINQKSTRSDGIETDVSDFSDIWVRKRGVKTIRTSFGGNGEPKVFPYELFHSSSSVAGELERLSMKFQCLVIYENGTRSIENVDLNWEISSIIPIHALKKRPVFAFPNYNDYGYGIFLLDDKSRDYVLKNIHNEKDAFLRSMMWGSLWDSVREGELDPRVYVELAIKNLPTETDETITASVLSRVFTAFTYYLSDKGQVSVAHPLEDMLIREMQTGSTLGRRITFYRSFLNLGASMRAREDLKRILQNKFWPKPVSIGGGLVAGESMAIPLKTKDRFDIVTRLLILGDPEATKLLAELEKAETSDDAKRYAYAARAGFGSAENKAKYWNDFVNNTGLSESWIEAAFGPWNSIRHSNLTLPYLQKALQELPNHKRNRKIFFVNGWLAAFIGGQRSEEALAIVNKFLADNPNLDNDLRLKILENVDLIERAVRIRQKFY